MKTTILAIAIVFTLQGLMYAQPQEDLFTACLQLDLEGVKKAVDGGADVNLPNSASGQNALAYSYFSADITKYLLEQDCDPNGGIYPALVSAASVASLEVMKLLLDNGADPNKKGGNEAPLFKIVQMTNCAEAAELLLSKGADKNTSGGVYANLIGVYASYGLSQSDRKAAMTNYGNVLKGYGLTVPDWYYNPSDQLNAPPGEMLKVLVDNGYDANARTKLTNIGGEDEPGEPPLFTALNLGRKEIIFSLLDNGADYNATYHVINPGMLLIQIKGEYSPLMYASTKGYNEVVEWLVNQPDLVNTSISGTICTKKASFMRLTGISAIYLAIMYDDLDIVKILAESSLEWDDFVIKALPGKKFVDSYGAKPPVYQFKYSKKQRKLKYTPARYAEFSNKSEMAEYLTSKGL